MRCLCCGLVKDKASASNPHICEECEREHVVEPPTKEIWADTLLGRIRVDWDPE